MSTLMDEEIKRWTARRKTALVLDIIQGKTTVAEASRAYDLTPSEVESWVEDGKKGMENALKANRKRSTKPLIRPGSLPPPAPAPTGSTAAAPRSHLPSSHTAAAAAHDAAM